MGLLAVPAAAVGARALGALAATAFASRPSARGSSTTRCAQCGATAHAMLDPSCPDAPRVIVR
jgi:hypothetical protein